MRTLQTEILILGGGATGTGLARDLAMRGFKTVLVEQNDLATGTTGRYHGLLHSGGRYVVKDPLAARECIEENRILRRIMPQCIEDTGGYFVLTPEDDPAYSDRFVAGCHQAGVPCEEINIASMLQAEPLLNREIRRCFRVPDASADSFLAADLNAQSARQYGATILRYHHVVGLLTNGNRNTVTGASVHDRVKDEQVRIDADLVINATGAWAGKIAATAGITVLMTPGKGILMAVAHRVVNTVINRCKMPGDGDIIVPAHTVAVIGTTDVKVADPDHFGVETWELKLMLAEGEKLIPGFSGFRFLRAWAGVRPLFQEAQSQAPGGVAGNRDITRAFILLDHAVRDGVEGFLTITSGKWTTYRKMAEVTADKACEKLGVQRACRTHLEMLPLSGSHTQTGEKDASTASTHFHYLGHRLAQVEEKETYGNLICECEMATRNEVLFAIQDGQAQTIDDIRRDLRLGMGPCQAGFCTLRAAGLLHQSTIQSSETAQGKAPTGDPSGTSVEKTNVALRDFLQERWKGVRTVLWGQQMRQERVNELIYLNVLNAGGLLGPHASSLAPEEYTPAEPTSAPEGSPVERRLGPLPTGTRTHHPTNVLVIGAGLAGLTTAWQSALQGKKVKLIAKGWGTTHWSSGCIDLLGYSPDSSQDSISSPEEEINKITKTLPQHPYALAGLDTVKMAIRSFQALFEEAGYPLHGSLSENWLLPTALGTIRPTCLAPASMVAGDTRKPGSMLLVGFEQFLDFYPSLAAANLTAQGIPARAIVLDLTSLKKRRFVNSMSLARNFDKPEFRAEVAAALKSHLGQSERVGFPAVLGLEKSSEACRDLEARLGRPVFELPGLPPSIPGIRLHTILTRAIRKAGGRIYDGTQVIGGYAQNNQIQAVASETGNGAIYHTADIFVLATGGILGGGLKGSPPSVGTRPLVETALGLTIHGSPRRDAWFRDEFLGESGHPIFQCGIHVNSQFQPVEDTGTTVYENLYAIGGSLAACDPLRERSLEGVAIVTGFCVGRKPS